MQLTFCLFLSLVTVLIWGISSPHAAIINVSTASGLQSALNTAVAGDEIVLADGTYSGKFVINGANGTVSAPIVVRAAHRHLAILESPNPGCSWSGDNGITVSRSYWKIQDIRMRKQDWGIYLSGAGANNVTIQNMIIEGYRGGAIMLHQGANNNTIQNNVIGHSTPVCNGSPDDVGIRVYFSSGNTIKNNIVLATGDNGYQCAGFPCAGVKNGYGIFLEGNVADSTAMQNNILQGNLLFANGGKGVSRVLNGRNNMVRDNAFLWGEGGGASTDDCVDDSNSFINNISLGNYFSNWSTKGQSGGNKGHHLLQHNLLYLTDFSKTGTAYQSTTGTANCNGTKVANTARDNIFYSTGAVSGSRTLLHTDNYGTNFTATDHNLFWAPSSEPWTTNYVYQPTDIHSASQQPIFTNAAQGDFSLAAGSPGKGAASDGGDIGIQYNTYLKKTWLRNVFTLPTQRQDNLTTSVLLPVNPNHYYQVWFYVPITSFNGVENFNVEGTVLQRDIAGLVNGGWLQPGGPARWITLGRHKAADGILNISWSNPGSASKIFIRQLPTADEAYAWIVQKDSFPAPPTNLRIVTNP